MEEMTVNTIATVRGFEDTALSVEIGDNQMETNCDWTSAGITGFGGIDLKILKWWHQGECQETKMDSEEAMRRAILWISRM